jgi:hypothetical protein
MNQSVRAAKIAVDPAVSLERIVNNLVQHSLRAAYSHNTHIVNNVKGSLRLAAATNKAIPVMRDLLDTVVTNSLNGDIYITAERYRDVVILEIQERNNNNGYALTYSVGSLTPDASSIGGDITIHGSQKKVITISFSFPYEGMTA